MNTLVTIGFDADDTLWQNEHFYRLTEERFAALLAGHTDPSHLTERLLEAERRNVRHYGFGIKGFMLSMIETAIEVTGGRVPGTVISQIMSIGREMLAHPVELLPHARDVLEALSADYRLLLITKGDLFDQQRKIAESGLGAYFHAVEIVSGKDRATYERIFTGHGGGPERSMMIGNSLSSDVLPALDAGSWGVHVPHELNWALEHAEEPRHAVRFRQIASLAELLPLVEEIG
jgi:putative hydrolase of the HAD superfamily